MLAWVWLGFALGAGSQTAVVADDVTKGLLQRAQYEQVKISPDGQYLAIAHHEEHGTTVTVLDRKSLGQVSQIDPANVWGACAPVPQRRVVARRVGVRSGSPRSVSR